MRRRLPGVLLPALLLGLLALPVTGAGAATTAPADQGRRTHAGTIGGADFRVEVPARWNGTLLLFSHGYYFPGNPLPEIHLANRRETEAWLLDHGYALAASRFQGDGTGYLYEPAMRDQTALLDWFETHVGRPRRTVVTGPSMGATISVLLAERNPHRFDGVAAFCGEYDVNATFNMGLDIIFAIKTLLAPDKDIELVRASDPMASTEGLTEAVDAALTSEEGRARLALAAALGNVTGWYSAHQPPPTSPAERIRGQADWMKGAYIVGAGPLGRTDLERRAGGNPSSNVGVDYRRQLVRSDQYDLVRKAYRDAELDLSADLRQLAAAPRISSDPAAVRYLYRYGVARGRTPAPVITLHTTGDGGVVPDQERWYGKQVRRVGQPSRLRQLYVERGQHCSISAAEEIVTLRALLRRIEDGRWPNLSPRRLNAAAGGFGDRYHQVTDLGTWPPQDAAMPPAFTRFTPPRLLRPSR